MPPGESRVRVCGWVPSAGQVSLSVSVGCGDTAFYATRLAVWGLCNLTLCFLEILAVYPQSRFFPANETCAVVPCAPTTKEDPTFAALRTATEARPPCRPGVALHPRRVAAWGLPGKAGVVGGCYPASAGQCNDHCAPVCRVGAVGRIGEPGCTSGVGGNKWACERVKSSEETGELKLAP